MTRFQIACFHSRNRYFQTLIESEGGIGFFFSKMKYTHYADEHVQFGGAGITVVDF